MRTRPIVAALSLWVLLAPRIADAADAPQTAPGASCVDAVLRKVQCTNPDEVCRTLLPDRDPRSGSNLDAVFDFRTQDLGDGTDAYVFSHRPGKDPYVYLPNFHFVRSGDRLQLVFDGRGVPTTYLTDRPRLNRRYQIERVSRADIPGLYRKREAERWFWNGNEYALAFTRQTIEQAKDAKVNGVTTKWSPGAEDAYRQASVSWTHTVSAGDTLGGIASKFGVSTEEIMRQNDIRDAGSLRLGQRIRYDGWKVTAR